MIQPRREGHSRPGGLLSGLFQPKVEEAQEGYMLKKVNKVESKEEFDEILSAATADGRLVVLNVSMTWCGPCKVIEPTFALFAEAYRDAVFCYFAGDKSDCLTAYCTELDVQEVPAFLFYREGSIVGRCTGKNKDVSRAAPPAPPTAAPAHVLVYTTRPALLPALHDLGA